MVSSDSTPRETQSSPPESTPQTYITANYNSLSFLTDDNFLNTISTSPTVAVSGDLSAGAIAGIVVGSVAGPVIIVLVIIFLVFRCQRLCQQRFGVQRATRLSSEKSDGSSNKPTSPVIVVITDCGDTDGRSHFVLPSSPSGANGFPKCVPNRQPDYDVSENGCAYNNGAELKLVPDSDCELDVAGSSTRPWSKTSAAGLEPGVIADKLPTGIDNPTFCIVDDDLPSLSSFGQLSPGVHRPNATSTSSELNPSYEAQSVIRRSYRLDNNAALAIAAQLNRDSSVLFDDTISINDDSDIVIVYKERTAL